MKKRIILPFLILISLFACKKDDEGNDPLPESPTESRMEFLERKLSNNSSNYIMVAAHRSNCGGYPENSLAAIDCALEAGVDIIEIDIRITIDNKLVVYHDSELGGVSTGSGKISTRPSSYVMNQTLRDANGNMTSEKIPSLEAVLLKIKDRALVLLDKSEFLLTEVKTVLNQTGTLDQAIFIGFEDYGKARDSYKTLLDSAHYFPGMHHTNNSLQAYFDDFENQLNPKAYALWLKSTTSNVVPFMGQINSNGARMWMSTTDPDQCAGRTDKISLSDPSQGWGWCIQQGATIIHTDRCEQLLNYLNSINARN